MKPGDFKPRARSGPPSRDAYPPALPLPGPQLVAGAAARAVLGQVAEQQLRDPGAGFYTDPGSGIGAALPGMGPAPPSREHPGGELLTKLLHPTITCVEQLYRKLPEDSWFLPTTSPSRPVQFELGSYEVPSGQMYWLFDYRFKPYEMSGTDPGGFRPVESGRFSDRLGFDLTVNGHRVSQLLYQLDPTPVVLARQQYRSSTVVGRRVPQSAFDSADANNFAAATSQGTSLLPQRDERQGAESGPFTIVCREGQRVSLSCVIFKPIPVPLGAMEGRHAGFLLHTQVSEILLNRLRVR